MKLGIHYQLLLSELPEKLIQQANEIVKNDLEEIRKVKISFLRIDGDDLDFLLDVASWSKELNFQVWFGPKKPNVDKEEFLELVKNFASTAEKLELNVFVVGNELSVELKDFAKIHSYRNRCENWKVFQKQFQERKQEFSNYLILINQEARKRFSGPITYAAGNWELNSIDWKPFDMVSANLYWWKYFPEKEYLSTLDDLKAFGKPLAITEFGFQTLKEAFEFGPCWWMRKKYLWHYNEKSQAKLIKKNIKLLKQKGVNYAFLHQWREGEDAGFGVIKTDGKPKKVFQVIF